MTVTCRLKSATSLDIGGDTLTSSARVLDVANQPPCLRLCLRTRSLPRRSIFLLMSTSSVPPLCSAQPLVGCLHALTLWWLCAPFWRIFSIKLADRRHCCRVRQRRTTYASGPGDSGGGRKQGGMVSTATGAAPLPPNRVSRAIEGGTWD